MKAVILAGGQGTRLKPFTKIIPKPLLPIGDMPVLEVLLRQLRYYGVTDVVLAVNHLAGLIRAFFGDGGSLGIRLSYSMEEGVLGTAGPLRLIKGLEDDFLVMNGDLLTTIDFGDFWRFHETRRAAATIAAFKKEVRIDLGVLKTEGEAFVDYIEKPTYFYDVSMGIYAMNRRVIDFIPAEGKFDIPDLMLALRSHGEKIFCYSSNCEWLDIGRVDDYEHAVELFESKRNRYLPAGEA